MLTRLRIVLPLLCLFLLSGCTLREEEALPASSVLSEPERSASSPESSLPEPLESTENELPPEPSESVPPAPLPEQSREESSAASAPPAEPAPEESDADFDEPAVFTVASLNESLRARITGVSFQEEGPIALDDLRLVTVTYLDFSGNTRTGELLVHHTLAQEVADIFAELYAAKFPIAGIALIDDYDADDDASMAANNSSAFCTRNIAGTDRYSRHSYGAAVDLNPVQNPYVVGDSVKPTAAEAYLDRENIRPGMIVTGDACHTAFTSRGWTWGGVWANPDYQHFEKAVS